MNHKEICSILKNLREELGFSLNELADLLGMDASEIDRWETGQEEPTISDCLLLSTLYGIDLNEMFLDLNVMSLIPKERIAAFQQTARLNRYANRWYD